MYIVPFLLDHAGSIVGGCACYRRRVTRGINFSGSAMTDDLKQRAEQAVRDEYAHWTLAAELLAALVQAEQIAALRDADTADQIRKVTDLEAKLVQAEQEKAVAQQLHSATCFEAPKDAQGRLLLNAYGRQCYDAGREAAESRLSTYEATIRQVAQEMRKCGLLVYGESYRQQIAEWADALQAAILPDERK
jgi:hypothetical protein